MNQLRRLDLFLILPALALCGISIFLLASGNNNLFISQIIFMVIGLFLYFVTSSIDFQIWPSFNRLFYLFSLVLLGIIFFLPQVRGAHRWIDFGFFILQPSEVLKPLIILVYAEIFSRQKNISFPVFLKYAGTFLPFLILIFLQPDLGNALIYSSFFIGLTIISGINLIYLLASFLAFIIFLPNFWSYLKDYQRARILSFLNPQLDPSGAGYNAIQSIIAIGSGGLLGLGLGRGTQSRLLFLPEYQTDFIFATLVESLGFVGAVILLGLYLLLLIRILMTAFNSPNRFGRFLSIGIFCQLFTQIFVNVGMNMGLLPITGITLPLLSYGGSSIVSTFIGLGLVNSISAQIPKKLLVIR